MSINDLSLYSPCPNPDHFDLSMSMKDLGGDTMDRSQAELDAVIARIAELEKAITDRDECDKQRLRADQRKLQIEAARLFGELHGWRHTRKGFGLDTLARRKMHSAAGWWSF